MKVKIYVRTIRRVQGLCILAVVVLAAAVGMKLAKKYCAGGSSVTNPEAFASAHVAAGLRAVRH